MAPKARRKRKRAGGGGPDGGSAESLYEELREHQLGSEQKQLLKRSATVGRALTSRERLQDALARRRLGLPPPPDAKERLMHEDEVPSCPPKSARKPDLSHRTPPRSSVQLPASTRQPGWEGSATEASHNTAYTASDPAASISPDLLAEQVMAFDPNNRAHAKLLELQQMAQSKRAGHSGYSKFEARKYESKGERNTSTADRPVFKQFVVRVNRRDDIQNVRKELPIIGMEQEIVETVTYNDISIVCGNTGCGKTTQVPQFLYEAGYGHADAPDPSGAIAVTQPRRVAVTSTARRVADELNLCVGQEVGYQVRYDRQLSDETSLKFMTDGILLREVQEDLLLRKYGVIIVDEAHERSVNTDILLGILSRVVALRRKMADEGALRLDGETVKPLKLIVMSATLRVHDFRENEKLCPRPPPLIQVPSRQFPVTVHFARRTELHDYASAAYKKVSAIHRKLPKGDILVFLTGKREVENLCKKLQQGFGKRGSEGLQSSATVDDSQSSQHEDESHAMDAFDIDEADAFGDQQDEDLSDSDSGVSEDDIEEDEEAKCVQQRLRDTPAVEHSDNEDKSKDDGEDDTQQQHPKRPPWMRAVPLYATLAPSRQAKVFGKHNSDERLVIVATNVAETSLTIPGVRYVVDSGRAKYRVYERGSGLSRFEVDWISKASAEQRCGRAGRTGPGHCYRLYSAAHFHNNFDDHSQPAILNIPIEGTVLQMKAMGIDKVTNFPFPTSPSRSSLADAERSLVTIGALESQKKMLTPLGKAMSAFPISPRHSRMLLEALSAKGTNANCLRAAVAVTAVLSLESPFLSGDEGSQQVTKGGMRRAMDAFQSNTCDAITGLNALREYEEQLRKRGARGAHDFCSAYNLHYKTLKEMMELRHQLANLLDSGRARLPRAASVAIATAEHGGVDVSFSGNVPHIDWTADAVLRRAICSGWCDRIAKRASTSHVLTQTTGKALRYTPCSGQGPVYLHPSSSLHSTAPPLVAYTEVLQTAKRPYMLSTTLVEAEWLPETGSTLCTVGQPLSDPPPRYEPAKDDVIAVHPVSYGEHAWDLPRIERPMEANDEAAPIFAAALLEGKVVHAFGNLRAHLAAPPKTAAKASMQGQRRVAELVHALQEAGIRSRAALCSKWAENSSYLKRELKLWFRDPSELEKAWPALLHAEKGREKKGRRNVKKGTQGSRAERWSG